MLQIEVAANKAIRIIEWGCSFDGSAAATPGQVELFETTVAATMSTASVAADASPWSDPNAAATTQALTFGSTTHTGFATAGVTEGSVANYRTLDLQMISPTGQYFKQFPLGREPEINPGGSSKFVRVRMTFGATINSYIYVIYEE